MTPYSCFKPACNSLLNASCFRLRSLPSNSLEARIPVMRTQASVCRARGYDYFLPLFTSYTENSSTVRDPHSVLGTPLPFADSGSATREAMFTKSTTDSCILQGHEAARQSQVGELLPQLKWAHLEPFYKGAGCVELGPGTQGI